MQATLKRFNTWLFQLRGAEAGEIVLVQRRIFILPTGAGVTFAVVLMLMLTGSINYNLSLGFILTFLLGSLGITAMLHTFRNVAGLRISAVRTPPVFAGETAHFRVSLHNAATAERYAVALTRDKREVTTTNVPARGSVVVLVAVPAQSRGLLRPGRITLFTRFPVGLFYAWSYIDLDTHCVVFPRPAPPGLPLPPLAPANAAGAGLALGRDDFAGLRQYHPGDSPRHIAWKAAARGQGLLTKQFSGWATAELWLSLESLPHDVGLEEKLSRLTRWVLDAHAAAVSFGLELPGKRIPVSSGEAHRDHCLEALALFDARSGVAHHGSAMEAAR